MGGIFKVLRWLGGGLGVVIAVLAAVFGMLQTLVGKAWVAREIAQAVSDPDFTVAIDGLGGIVPFGMTVERIDTVFRPIKRSRLGGIPREVAEKNCASSCEKQNHVLHPS